MLFMADGLSYLYGAFTKTFVAIPQDVPKKSRDRKQLFLAYKRDTKEGLIYVWRKRGLRLLFFAFAFINLFLTPIVLLLPFYTEDFLKVKADWYGFIAGGFGAGAMLGNLLAGVWKLKGSARSASVTASLLLFSVCCGSLGLVNVPILALVIVLAAGVSQGFLNISIFTTLQLTTPSEMRGRIFGLLGTVAGGLAPLALGLSGLVADLTGKNIPLIYMICGGAMTLLSIALATNREFRELVALKMPT